MTTDELAKGYLRKCSDRLVALAKASKDLRKEREFSFYGDIDFIPTMEYTTDDTAQALQHAQSATATLNRILG